MNRKLLSLVSAGLAVSVVFLAGCKKNNSKTAIDMSAEYGDYPIQTDETLTFWSALHPNASSTVSNLGETEYAKELEKETGIKIEYIHPAVGKEAEAFSLLLASGEYPDMIKQDWMNAQGGPSAMISDKVILPLNDLMEKYAPNLSKYLKDNPDIDRQIKTDNNEYYVFPFIRGDESLLLSAGPIVRDDWLKDLGLSAPKTISDWENMLAAFKDKKGATAPLTLIPANDASLYFLFDSTPGFYVDNNTVKYGPMESEYRTAVETLHKWYENGWLDKNYISADSAAKTYNILGGVSGVTFGGGGGDLGKWMEAKKDDPNFSLAGISYPLAANGKPVSKVSLNTKYSSYGSVAITTSCKNPSLAAKWLDYGYSEKGHMLNNFGIENKSYTMVDGYPKYSELITKNPDGLSFAQAMSLYTMSYNNGPFVQDKRYLEQYYQTQAQRNALSAWLECYDESSKHSYPTATLTEEESSQYASLYNEIEKYRNEQTTGFIRGTISLDKYDNYLATLKQLNADKVIEIKQAAYDRYLKR